jgi:hypothetical protein
LVRLALNTSGCPLETTVIPMPVSRGGEMLLRVRASGIDPVDTWSAPAPDRRPSRHNRSQVGLEGAEAILTLRAVIANGDFEDYWRYHLTQEHQRLYPGTAQGQYTLST